MSLPETLEIDLRKAWVDRSIWLHIWLWYFWEEAVLARLRSLLKTCKEQKNKVLKWRLSQFLSVHSHQPILTIRAARGQEDASWPVAWTPCWFCFLSASSPGGPYTGTSCSTPRKLCGGAWWRSRGGEWDCTEKRVCWCITQLWPRKLLLMWTSNIKTMEIEAMRQVKHYLSFSLPPLKVGCNRTPPIFSSYSTILSNS